MKDFPIDRVRDSFPALRFKGKEQVFPVYFDGPGGTQMAQQAIDKMLEYITTGMANLSGTFSTSIKTDELLVEARRATGDLLNCEPQEVAFGQNMTSLAFQISWNLRSFLKEGDEIVVTEQDHRANVDPWLSLAEETGAKVKFIPLNRETYSLDLENLEEIITPRTRLVAAGLSSNLTGSRTAIDRILKSARQAGALTAVDAVHAVPHFPVDFKQLDCDILFCSAYKFFGPHLGIAVIRASLFEKMPVKKLEPAPKGIPNKLETGTQNHEGIAGLCGALGFIEGLGAGENRQQRLQTGMKRIERYEEELMEQMQIFLESIPEINLFRAPEGTPKTPTFAFKIKDIHSRKAAKFFAEKFNIYLGDGHFYASTMAEIFGVMDTGGWLRVGFAPYNTMEEIDLFKKALKECISFYEQTAEGPDVKR